MQLDAVTAESEIKDIPRGVIAPLVGSGGGGACVLSQGSLKSTTDDRCGHARWLLVRTGFPPPSKSTAQDARNFPVRSPRIHEQRDGPGHTCGPG